ncbi:hypothetical protein AB0M22_38685 [Nocardia sp. NPDC051756]|uniref:hypothetical protein n=1 Tax=Nocardia sp. NPDC051756 TaxID=3154751 RepID=UPI00342ED0F5
MEKPYDRDHAPDVHLLAAWFVLGSLPDELPWWAAQWLVEGHDGPALRELAGLNERDPRAVGDLLPEAMAEMGIALPANDIDATNVLFCDLAWRCLSGQLDERQVGQKVTEVLAVTNYDSAATHLPLGQLYWIEDEWQAGWGRPAAELEAEVRKQCTAQLAATSTTT